MGMQEMSDLPILKTIAVTGHRPPRFGGYDERSNDTIIAVKRSPEQVVDLLVEAGAETFISGVALGVDTWAAEAVLGWKKRHPQIRLMCAVPHENVEVKWPPASQTRFHSILKRADRVVLVSKGDYSPEKLLKRNEWMIDHADGLLAVWDGSPGGTAHTVHYAESVGKPVHFVRW